MNETTFHLACFSASVPTGTTNYTDVVAISDGVLTRQNNHLVLPVDGKIRLASALSADLQRARINVPSLRQVGRPHLAPTNSSATVPSPVNLYDPLDTPLIVPRGDEFAVEAIHGNAGAQVVNIFTWIQFGYKAIPSGQRYRIRFTSTITGSTTAWASGALTPEEVLPGGTYQVVGMDVVGANILAGRLIYPGGGYRPGCLARNAVGSIRSNVFSNGDLGCYGAFENVALPSLEIFCVGASASQECYLDLIRTSSRF